MEHAAAEKIPDRLLEKTKIEVKGDILAGLCFEDNSDE